MDHIQYRQFLNDPVAFLNAGPVKRLRINMNPAGAAFRNTVQRTTQHPGVVPTYWQYADALVAPVSLRIENSPVASVLSAVWVESKRPAPGASFVNDRAYWLKWNADKAYAIALGHEAQLFFTATLTGCGILVFETPQKLIVIHHNVQVPTIGQGFVQRLLESRRAHQERDQNNRFDVQAQALEALAQHIISENPSIRGVALNSPQYYSSGQPASVFGIKRGGRWRIYANTKTGADYRTDVLYK
jgi:hypothetical protein